MTQVKGLGLREFTWQKWIIGYNFGTDDGAESKFGASKELMVLNILNYECCVNKRNQAINIFLIHVKYF